MLGQIVYTTSEFPGPVINKELNLSYLSNGVYVVRVRSDEASYTQKIIIQQ